MAEAYGWGKFFGIFLPWIINLGNRLSGVDVYRVEGSYLPFFYALSDQIRTNISGVLFLKRTEGSWSSGFSGYIHHPVMLASLFVIIIVPFGLFGARVMGFSFTIQTFTALETIATNLCWVLLLKEWLNEKYR
jgi:hypothetical protein